MYFFLRSLEKYYYIYLNYFNLHYLIYKIKATSAAQLQADLRRLHQHKPPARYLRDPRPPGKGPRFGLPLHGLGCLRGGRRELLSGRRSSGADQPLQLAMASLTVTNLVP